MAANRRGILFIISGPSGTGKGSIIKEMLKITDPEALVLSTSMTTRKPREGEVDGVSYFFVSKEDFIKGIEAEDFLEYAEVFGNYYGTPKSKVMEKLERGIDVILEIDVQGAIAVKEKYSEAVMIFILPPSHKELRRRLNKRGTEEKDVIELRLSEAAREISCL